MRSVQGKEDAMKDDLIKRSDAIKAIDSAWINGTSLLDANETIKQLKALPSADRPQGEWISKHNGYWTCSECGLSFLFYAKGNYCPNCGARMFAKDISVPNKEGADDDSKRD